MNWSNICNKPCIFLNTLGLFRERDSACYILILSQILYCIATQVLFKSLFQFQGANFIKYFISKNVGQPSKIQSVCNDITTCRWLYLINFKDWANIKKGNWQIFPAPKEIPSLLLLSFLLHLPKWLSKGACTIHSPMLDQQNHTEAFNNPGLQLTLLEGGNACSETWTSTLIQPTKPALCLPHPQSLLPLPYTWAFNLSGKWILALSVTKS